MYLQPIEIAEGIFWVGFVDTGAGLHCNPYLIVEGNEAVLIDGGSRGDFSTVMLKILRAGVNPNNINRLIYHHADPDLCGNIPHLEAIIENPDLKIISHKDNNTFINYYSSLTPKECIEDIGYKFRFSTGRTLRFIHTPYAHTPGNFMTYDEKTKTLFSSDLFGSYDRMWELYLKLYFS
jgi:flavorubredoxin